MALTKWHWLAPLALLGIALLWLIFVKSENGDVIQLTRNQYIDQHLEYIDVINLKRRSQNLPEIDQEQFQRLYNQKLAEIQARYPISAYFARKRRLREEEEQKKDQ